MVEYTKNYTLLGEEVPLDIKIYNNGNLVTIKNKLLNFTLSCPFVKSDELDKNIIYIFEQTILNNMRVNKIDNFKEYIEYIKNRNKQNRGKQNKKKKNKSKYKQKEEEIILFKFPDDTDNMMIGIKEN